MKRTAKLAVVAYFCALSLLLFVIFAPIVWTDVVPCIPFQGQGYTSISGYLFNSGMSYVNGHFLWRTQGLVNCM